MDTVIVNIAATLRTAPEILSRTALAIGMTLTLMLLMYSLVKVEDIPHIPEPPIKIPPVTSEETRIEIITDEDPVKPAPPVATPDLITDPIPIAANPYSLAAPVTPVVATEQTIVVRLNRVEPIPIFRVSPVYPNRLLTRGIEGYVDLIFNVDEIGGTQNIRVADAVPESIFNKAATKAVAKWKYEPRMENGIGIYQKDIMTRVRFAISD